MILEQLLSCSNKVHQDECMSKTHRRQRYSSWTNPEKSDHQKY